MRQEGVAAPAETLFPKTPSGNQEPPAQHESRTPASGFRYSCYTRSRIPFFVGTMSHALDHALRNAPSDKPLPPWLQQLQAQWQAAKHAFGSTRGSESSPVSVDGSSLGKRKPMRRKSSLHSLKKALLHTKDALLAAIGMLPRKHAVVLDDSWLYRIQANRM
jgi:hypothetical protein